MQTKWFRYRIIIPWYLSLAMVKDMLRYSRDEIIDKISDSEFLFVHRVDYESAEHLQRRLQFFERDILGRWKSFGCKVSDLTEVVRYRLPKEGTFGYEEIKKHVQG